MKYPKIVSSSELGSIQKGGKDHIDALNGIYHALNNEKFIVNILKQDGSDLPDAKAHHTDLDRMISVEAETTTPSKPAKIIKNFAKAKEKNRIPLFVVRPGGEDVTAEEPGKDYAYWARRVENILTPPVKEKDMEAGYTEYYTQSSLVKIDTNVIALRPATGDDRRSIWSHAAGGLCLCDGNGTEYAHIDNMILKDIGPTHFPAVSKYDMYTGDHFVSERTGVTERYSDADARDADWVPVREPVLPLEMIPKGFIRLTDFYIMILDDDYKQSSIYRKGETYDIDVIITGIPSNETESESATIESNLSEKDMGVDTFALVHLIQDENKTAPLDDVYEKYKKYANINDYPTRNRSQFSITLRQVYNDEIKSKRTRINGHKSTVYIGLELMDKEPQIF